jgi:hypothetical protein
MSTPTFLGLVNLEIVHCMAIVKRRHIHLLHSLIEIVILDDIHRANGFVEWTYVWKNRKIPQMFGLFQNHGELLILSWYSFSPSKVAIVIVTSMDFRNHLHHLPIRCSNLGQTISSATIAPLYDSIACWDCRLVPNSPTSQRHQPVDS